MIKTEKYIVGTERGEAYKSLYSMTPQNDEYMHLTSAAYEIVLENLRLHAKKLGY